MCVIDINANVKHAPSVCAVLYRRKANGVVLKEIIEGLFIIHAFVSGTCLVLLKLLISTLTQDL